MTLPLLERNDNMSKVIVTNIGMLATPQGSSPKKGPEQGNIQILSDAWVLMEDGIIAQVGTGPPRRRTRSSTRGAVWSPPAWWMPIPT